MNLYKAPGLDGFQPIFYRSYWDIMRDKIWQLVAKALITSDLPQTLTNTRIV